VAFRLRMPAQIGDWLADLAGSDPESAAEVGAALLALASAEPVPGPPLVTARDEPDAAGLREPADPREALNVSYQQLLEGLHPVRRLMSDVITAVAAADEALGQARLSADADPVQIAAAEDRLAQVRRDRETLARTSQRLQASVDAFRTQKETAKAVATAAEARLRIEQALAAAGLDPDEHELGDAEKLQDEATVSLESTRTYAATLMAALAGDDEHEPAPAPSPDEADVRELRADRLGADIRVLFAAEPPGTITVLTVLEGAGAVRDHRDDAIGVAGQLLAEIRAAGWPPDADPASPEFDAPGSFLERFFPAAAGDVAERAAALASAVSLASLRDRQDLSADQVAGRAGSGPDRILSIERKPEHASASELAAYARALGGTLRLTISLDGEDHRLG
jgi:hypothetical protein